MRISFILSLLFSLTILSCSAPNYENADRKDLQIPTKLIFASPKIKPLTPEMKKTYQDWVSLMAVAQETQNCQTLMIAPIQRSMPFYNGDSVRLKSKIQVLGFFCPLKMETLSDANFTVLSNDIDRRLTTVGSDFKMTSNLSVVDPTLRANRQLLSTQITYSSSGKSSYAMATKNLDYSVLSYTALTETLASEKVIVSLSGESSDGPEGLALSWNGFLKTKDLELEVTTFQKNGLQQTYLNGHLITPDDHLPEFPIPQVETPKLKLRNL